MRQCAVEPPSGLPHRLLYPQVSNPANPPIRPERVSHRWAEGRLRCRRLFNEIKARGYSGSFSNLESLLAKWRWPQPKVARLAPAIAAVQLSNRRPGG